MPFWAAGASILGGLLASDAAGDAASTQVNAATQAAQISAKQRQPWVDAGTQALHRLSSGLTPAGQPTGATGERAFNQAGYDAALARYQGSATPGSGSGGGSPREGDGGAGGATYGLPMPNREDFYTPGAAEMGTGEYTHQFTMDDATNSDAYKFALKEGVGALENSAAARGELLSTNTNQGLVKYAEGVAGTFQNQAFNQWMQQLQTQLGAQQSLAQVGQTASSQVADTSANALLSAGRSQAGGIIGQANAMTGALSDAGNQIDRALRMRTPGTTQPAYYQYPMSTSNDVTYENPY